MAKIQARGTTDGGIVIPTVSSLPASGEAGEVVNYSGSLYQWDTVGSTWEEVGRADEIDVVAADLATHEARTDNPHSVTAAQVGFTDPILDKAEPGAIGGTTAAAGTFTDLTATEQFALSGIATSSALSTQQDDLAVGDVATYRINATGALDLTGLATGATGREVRLANVGSAVVTLKHESASSTAANRFDLSDDTDVELAAGGVLLLRYDGTLSRWQVVGGAGSGGIGGSTGSTDNAALRADGIGGSTAQGSLLVIADSGALTTGDSTQETIGLTLLGKTTGGVGESLTATFDYPLGSYLREYKDFGLGNAELLSLYAPEDIEITVGGGDLLTYDSSLSTVYLGDPALSLTLYLGGNTINAAYTSSNSEGSSDNGLTTQGYVHTYAPGFNRDAPTTNYIKNGHFELGETGWTATTGTGNTNGRTTSSPLRGSASWAMGNLKSPGDDGSGDQAAYAFAISEADQNKIFTVGFDARLLSSDSRDTYFVTIYDVDNAETIASLGAINHDGLFLEYFATTGSTNYEFRITNSYNGTDSAKGLTFDGVFIGPNRLAHGAIITPWQTFTPTASNVSWLNVEGFWRRVGDSAEILVSGRVSSVSGAINPDLPSGLTADADKLGAGTGVRDSLGPANAYDDSAGASKVGCVYMAPGGPAHIVGEGGNVWGSGAAPFAWASADRLSYRMTVPIQGWDAASPITVATEPYLWAERYAGSATRVTSTPAALGEYRARIRNGSGTHNLADTAPTDAPTAADGCRIYGVAFSVNGTSGQASQYQFYVGKNVHCEVSFWSGTGRTGEIVNTARSTFASNREMGVGVHYDPSTGVLTVDAVTAMQALSNWTVGVYGTGSGRTDYTNCYFDILVTPKTNALALAQEARVFAHATSDAGQTLTAGVSTQLVMEDVSEDTHGIIDTATGDITIPHAALYCIEQAIYYSMEAGESCILELYQNGTLRREIMWRNDETSAGRVKSAAAVWNIRLAAGDVVKLQATANPTNDALDATSTRNYVTVTEVGR